MITFNDVNGDVKLVEILLYRAFRISLEIRSLRLHPRAGGEVEGFAEIVSFQFRSRLSLALTFGYKKPELDVPVRLYERLIAVVLFSASFDEVVSLLLNIESFSFPPKHAHSSKVTIPCKS